MPSSINPRMGGIRVQRDTLIVVEDGHQLFHGQHTSQSTTIRSIKSDEIMDSQLQQYTRPKTFRKLSNASSIITDIFRPETSEDTIQRKIKKANDRDTSRDLIDFLRNTTPPPQNYMSFPDRFEPTPTSKKRHHHFCWSFWKRSKRGKNRQKKSPGLIKLPDSAVAGRTIGGHRHIAISIPIEYAHPGGLTRKPVSNNSPGTLLTSVEEKCEPLESPPQKQERQELAHSRSRSWVTDSSVGALSVLASAPHELTPLQEETESQICSLVSVAGTSAPRNTVDDSHPDVLPASRQFMDQPLEARPHASPTESFHTTTSDPIMSEAVTVHLPSSPLLDKSPSTICSSDLVDAAELSSYGSLSGLGSEVPRETTPISVGTTGSEYETPDQLSIQSRLTPIFPPLEPLVSYTPRPRPPCTCCITPVMTVVDVRPTSTSPHLREKHSVIKKTSFVLPDIQITSAEITSSPRSRPRKSSLHHMPSIADIRSTASIERIVLSRQCKLASTSTTAREPSTSHRRAPRSESHQELIRRFEELRITRNREVELLISRLQQLETTNERWMNTMIPLFEVLTERLTNPRSSHASLAPDCYYHNHHCSHPNNQRHSNPESDLSGATTPRNSPTPPRPKSRKRHHHQHHLVAPLESEDSIDSFDWGRIPNARHRGSGHVEPHQNNEQQQFKFRAASDTSSHYWDPDNDVLLANPGFGTGGVAVDRCPTRHGESLLGGDFGTMFASRVREIEAAKLKRAQEEEKEENEEDEEELQERAKPRRERVESFHLFERPASQLSGMETIEPVMRELVSERDLRQEEKYVEEQ
ncbi:hypothetical protein QBC44DRAFT_323621 [Cladorrhinum sp. PSN332]|nr:hypothetical protein QBC44DRAFT_323621 [Cladorrhinum sp. PSN332]